MISAHDHKIEQLNGEAGLTWIEDCVSAYAPGDDSEDDDEGEASEEVGL